MQPADLLAPAAVLAAGEGPPPFLTSTAVLVVAAAVIGYLSVRAKVVPIVGFLVAGVVIGPNQLGLVSEIETVEAAAEIGVIFLLFIIGIEFSLERLAALRTWIAVGGALQVALAVGSVTGICMALGVDWRDGLFTGFLVSLSSTAIVLKLLGDARETTTTRGRLAVALLVFQDLAVVAMVLFVPLLGAGGGEGEEGSSTLDLVVALLTAVGIIAAVLLVARRLLPPVLERVARTCSPEVFLLTVLAICFGTAYLTAVAGVSVSLGAFLAGLVVSESRLSSQALGEILPLQILFSAVFFVSVGMLLDLRFVLSNLPVVLAGVVVVFLVKLLTTWLAVSVLRRTGPGLAAGPALGTALLLAQVGEFSFVLETAGRSSGLSPGGLGEDGSQAFIAASVLLLLATPLLAGLGRRVEARLEARDDGRRQAAALAGRAGPTPQPVPTEPDGTQVLLSGWGPATRSLAAELSARGVDLTVTTLNPDGAAEAEADGHRVVMGDSTKSVVLEMAGLERTRLLVVAEDEQEQAVQIAGVVHGLARYDVPVLARPLGGVDLAQLSAVGVHRVVDPEGASRRALTRAVLHALGDEGGPLPAVVLPGGQGSRGGNRTTVDMSRVVVLDPRPGSEPCEHLRAVPPVLPTSLGCEECLREGTSWVHLRVCTTCGAVGCCDSSPGQHARAHAGGAGHPVVASLEDGESWAYCFTDGVTVEGR